MKIFLVPAVLALVLCTAMSGPARAVDAPDSIDSVRATVLNLIRALVDQGVLTAAKAQDMLRQAGLDPALLNAPQVSQAPPAVVEAPKPVVRVPYIPETVKDEMREELRQEIVAQAREERWGQAGALPDWISRFTFFGDMRIRYQRTRATMPFPRPLIPGTSFRWARHATPRLRANRRWSARAWAPRRRWARISARRSASWRSTATP